MTSSSHLESPISLFPPKIFFGAAMEFSVPALGVEGRHDGDFPAADVGTVGAAMEFSVPAAGSLAIIQRA